MGIGVNSTFPGLRVVAVEPPLALSYLPGQGKTLVISLSGVGTKRWEQPPIEFFKMASQERQNHVLFVSDASRSWMNAPGLARQIVAAIEKTDIRIFHGGSLDERIHLDRFPRDPRAKHFVFPDMDHRLTFRLHKKRRLERIIDHAIAGRPWKLRREVEDSGGMLREAFDETLPQKIELAA